MDYIQVVTILYCFNQLSITYNTALEFSQRINSVQYYHYGQQLA